MVSDYHIPCAVRVCSVFSSVSVYRYALYNDVLVNDGPLIPRWSHNIIILTIVLQLPTIFLTVTCCTGL